MDIQNSYIAEIDESRLFLLRRGDIIYSIALKKEKEADREQSVH